MTTFAASKHFCHDYLANESRIVNWGMMVLKKWQLEPSSKTACTREGNKNKIYMTTQIAGGWSAADVRMSFFRHPISNRYPAKTVSLFNVYQMVRGPLYRPETMELRALKTEQEQRAYKQARLDFILPGGVFSYANDSSLVTASGLLGVDLDDIYDVEALKQRLMADKLFETLMLFRSPRGNGLKWFIEIDLGRCDYRQWFTGVRNYLLKVYRLTPEQVDPTSINVSRACWLCHDPEVYLRTDLIENFCI